MKNSSVSRLAFVSPRALIGFCSIGALSVLLVFSGLLSPSAWAQGSQCSQVEFDDSGHYPNNIYVTLSSATSGVTIFYRIAQYDFPADPTHNGSSATGGTQIYNGGTIVAPPGQNRYLKAVAYKAGMTDSIITSHVVENTGW